MAHVQDPETPLEVLRNESIDRTTRMWPRREDGFLIIILKVVLTPYLWQWLYLVVVNVIVLVFACRKRRMIRPDLCVRHAADAYMFAETAGLVVCYLGVLQLARDADPDARSVGTAIGWCMFPLFRFCEALSVVVMLHTSGAFHSPAPMRAASKTLWAYLEFVVIFATIYVAVAVSTGDRFEAPKEGVVATTPAPFVTSWVNPLYFSMISMATVGYGDFSPQTACARSVVALEVFSGLLLLVVVLQRVLAISLPQPPNPLYVIKRLRNCSQQEVQQHIAYLVPTPVCTIAELLKSGQCRLSKGTIRSMADLGALKTEFGHMGPLAPPRTDGEQKFRISEVLPLLKANPGAGDALLPNIQGIMKLDESGKVDYIVTIMRIGSDLIVKDGNKRTIAYFERRKSFGKLIDFPVYLVELVGRL